MNTNQRKNRSAQEFYGEGGERIDTELSNHDSKNSQDSCDIPDDDADFKVPDDDAPINIPPALAGPGSTL